jgi:hypothetical protein
MAEISDVLYEVCSRKTYQFRNNFNVVHLIANVRTAILHSDKVTYVKCARKLTRVADKINPSGRKLRIITANCALSQLSLCT